MFHVGTQEILIILAMALIIFGPKKLPEIGRSIGQGLRELRRASREVMDAVERDDEPEPVQNRMAGDSKENVPNAANSDRD
ncbi:MAG: twin-arginine translocase TatA/TatE family subunit [Armatimonadetes bacterium]|nr:twin-arginine translocase TatA/TatE family subunit [Armatimonadota bacterium]